jgi:tetratricopeptide (TPR) repeat protein
MAQSRDIAAQALEQARLLNRADGIAVSAQNLGEAELALGNLDAAEAASREVINTEERRYIPAALRLLGEIRLARVDLPMAEQLLRQSIHEAALNHDRYLESFAQQSLGRCLRKLGREKDARIAYDKAIELFDALSMAGESAKACHERDRNA